MTALIRPGGNLTGLHQLRGRLGMQMLRMARPRRQKFFIDGRRRYGGKSKVFRSTDDPNDVLLLQDVADVSKARTWYGSSEMKSLMEKSGVVGSPSIRSAA